MNTDDDFSQQLKFEIEIGFFEDYLKAMEDFFDSETEEHRANLEKLRSENDSSDEGVR